MSGTDEVTGLRFGRVASTIAVGDLDRARAFYCGVLGMRVVFENGDPIGFVILERDSAELHLTLDPGHSAARQNVAHLRDADHGFARIRLRRP